MSIQKALKANSEFEVIVINNGSTDKTDLKIKNFYNTSDATFTDKLKVFNINHVGLSEARNFGIKQSTGNLISFVDADAIVDVNWLNEINSSFKNHDVEIISGRVCNLDN